MIATGLINGVARGYLYLNESNVYRSDKANDDVLTSVQMKILALKESNHLTFTCVIPGRGWQMALDKNLDSTLNGDEV